MHLDGKSGSALVVGEDEHKTGWEFVPGRVGTNVLLGVRRINRRFDAGTGGRLQLSRGALRCGGARTASIPWKFTRRARSVSLLQFIS